MMKRKHHEVDQNPKWVPMAWTRHLQSLFYSIHLEQSPTYPWNLKELEVKHQEKSIIIMCNNEQFCLNLHNLEEWTSKLEKMVFVWLQCRLNYWELKVINILEFVFNREYVFTSRCYKPMCWFWMYVSWFWLETMKD